MRSLLIPLMLTAFVWSYGHEAGCGYHHIERELPVYQGPRLPSETPRLSESRSTSWGPLRMKFFIVSFVGIPDQDVFENIELARVARHYGQMLQVKQFNGNLVVPAGSEDCGASSNPNDTPPSQIWPEHQTTGVPDADFIIYMYVNNAQDNVLGFANSCEEWDGVNLRLLQPHVGFMTINSYYWNREESEAQKHALIMHEIGHALGWASPANSFYTGGLLSNGIPYSGWWTDPDTGNAYDPADAYSYHDLGYGSQLVMTTPRIVAAVREVSGCNTIIGALLEQDGGPGSAESHLEERVFYEDFMTASSSSDIVVFTKVSLAFFEDTGAYLPNYDTANTFPHLHDRGCGFFTDSCDAADFPGAFCSEFNLDPFHRYPYAGCSTGGTFNDGCGRLYSYPEHCYNYNTNDELEVFEWNNSYGSFKSPTSRMIRATIQPTASNLIFNAQPPIPEGLFLCAVVECTATVAKVKIVGTDDFNGQGNILPEINFECPRNAASETSLTPTESGVKGEVYCPAGDPLCDENIHACPSACYGMGECINGSECDCSAGYGGRSCEIQCHENCADCNAELDENACTECWENAELSGTAPSSCICQPPNTGTPANCVTAVVCDSTCATCETDQPDGCLTCKSGAEKQGTGTTGTCACTVDGWYGADAASCSQCHSSCRTCTDAGNDACTSCYANATENSGVCSCLSHYFPAGGDFSQCTECHVTCLECNSDVSTDCASCYTGADINGVGGCECTVIGFYGTNPASWDTCDSSCRTCSGGGTDACTSCFANASETSGVCSCDSHYFPPAGDLTDCTECHGSCLECTNETEQGCSSCNPGAEVNSSGECRCLINYYGQPHNCRECDAKCAECRQSASNCSACGEGAQLVNGQTGDCECASGYTGTPPNCVEDTSCDPSCNTCDGTTDNDCLTCFSNASVQVDGSCECDAGYYEVSSGGGGATTCDQCYTPQCSGSANNPAECTNPEVTITAGTGNNHIILECNNMPCHEMPGTGIYVTCPSSFTENMTFPNPQPCNQGEYYNGSQCETFSSSSSIQPHFGDVGFLGRPPNPTSHWSTTNQPIEAVSYDPLPAECFDVTAHACGNDYTGQFRFSVLDIQRINDAGGNVVYSNGQSVNVALDSYNAHVQPGGSTNPNAATYGVYHYHANPGWDNGDFADHVIGYAMDGIPFMGLGSTQSDGRAATSSYRLERNEGAYHMDYDYIPGLGTLDEYNGGSATIDGTPTYAYFSTTGYPYLFRNFKGEYSSGGAKQGSVAAETPQNCQQCDATCSTCDGPENTDCTACRFNSSENNSGICVCNDGYFELGNVCTDCHQTCKNCDGTNNNNCLACWPDGLLPQLGVCSCPDGQFGDATQSGGCTDCHSNCKTCIAGGISDCTSCYNNASGGTLSVPGACSCNDSFFGTPTSDLACLSCDSTCKTCNADGNSDCTSCYTNASGGTEVSPGACSCNDNFFGTPSSDLACLSCASTCKTCNADGNSDCTSCYTNASGATEISSGACSCNDNFFGTPTNDSACVSCHPTCNTCNGDTASNCESCKTDAHLTVNNSCECDEHFFGEANNCQECNRLWAECQDLDSNDCTACYGVAIISNGQSVGECVCPITHDPQPDATNCVALACDDSCLTCEGTGANNCLSCKTNAELDIDGSCQCTDGNFADGGADNCVSCHSDCKLCSAAGADNCDECHSNAGFNSDNECECNSGYFGSANSCQQCHEECLECSGANSNNCIDCHANADIVIGFNTCKCDDGWFGAPDDCQQCDVTCLTCTGSENTDCTSCKANAEEVGGACQCESHYFGSADSCEACDPFCNECVTNAPDGCTECYSNASLDGASPSTCSCDLTFTRDGNVCVQALCDSTCGTCSDTTANDCVTCKAGASLQSDGSCLCDDGKFGTADNCQDCNQSCKTCSGTADHCDSCYDFADHDNSSNTCTCQTHYFGAAHACQECDDTCKECSGASNLQCTECYTNAEKIQSGACRCITHWFGSPEACEECHYTCGECSGAAEDNCTDCLDNAQLDSTSSKCECSSHYFGATADTCQECDAVCKTCENSAYNCTECYNNAELTDYSGDKDGDGDWGDKDGEEDWGDKRRVQSSSVSITWEQYTVGRLNCYAGQAEGQTSYNKVVIHLHGGGSAGDPPYEATLLESGQYGDIAGIKFVYPSSWRSGGIWYETYKNGCSASEVCSHNQAEVEEAGVEVAALINYERNLKGWADGANIFLSGYSQGSRMVYQVQFGQLTYALGGCFVMCGFPQIPLLGMEAYTTSQAQAAVSYYGTDMNWMMFHGEGDPIYPPDESKALYDSVYEKLGVSSTIVYEVENAGSGHTLEPAYYYVMMNFVRDGVVTSVDDYNNNDDQTCECSSSYFGTADSDQACQACATTCETCDGPEATDCLTCYGNATLHSDGDCRCNSTYYGPANDCQLCNHTCQECDAGTVSGCTSCKDNASITGGIPGPCQCEPTHTGTPDNCQPIVCHPICDGCVGTTVHTCIDCIENASKLGGQCLCNLGYYFNVDVCDQCHPTCRTCSGSADTQCISCYTHASLDNNECICNTGYVEEFLVCNQCHSDCKECSASDIAYACTECYEGAEIVGGGSEGNCACQVGYDGTPDNCSQINCHPSCATCSGENATDCDTCKQGAVKVLDLCACQDGYFGSPENCVQCDESCETCTGAGVQACDSCRDDASLQEDRSCTCDPSFFLTLDPWTCNPCATKCKECSGSTSNDCIECHENAGLVSTAPAACACDETHYGPPDNCVALVCYHLCDGCTGLSAEDCIECLDGSPKEEGWCFCGQGTFDAGSQCDDCSPSCLECFGASDNNCIACHLNAQGNSNNECECIDQHYPVDGNVANCAPCHESCKECQGSTSDSCMACFDNAELENSASPGTCVCSEGFSGDAQSCEAIVCDDTCLTCFGTGADECTTCKDDAILQGDGSCICDEGYYGTPDNCQECAGSCRTCDGPESTDCVACHENATKQLDGTCICASEHFGPPQDCQACHPNCAECINSNENGCSSCHDNAEILNGLNFGECVCSFGFGGLPTNCVEHTCHPLCATCSGTELEDCIDCIDNAAKVDGLCTCDDNYFFNGFSCRTCNINCLTCSGENVDDCTSCYTNAEIANPDLAGTGACECLENFWGPAYFCTQCDSVCRTCDSVGCTDCFENASVSLNTCSCNTHYWPNPTAATCSVCNAECENCTGFSSNQCLTCHNHAERTNPVASVSSCVCSVGFVGTPDNCVQPDCHNTCETCSGSNDDDCITCKPYADKVDGRCECNAGWYMNALGNCQQCNNTCRTCEGPNITDCTGCKNMATLVDGRCYCSSGHFTDSLGNCTSCHQTCAECNGAGANECTSCFENAATGSLAFGSCDCNIGWQRPNGQVDCVEITCHNTCETCTSESANDCYSCKDNATHQEDGSCSCDDEWYMDSSGDCQACYPTCRTCTGAGLGNCIACKVDATLNDGECLCNPGFFEADDYNCYPCHETCLTCDGPSMSECKACRSTGYVFDDGYCLCADGYYALDSVCNPCHESCLLCDAGGDTNCEQCKTNAELDSVFGRCVCSDGLYGDAADCQLCHSKCLTCNGGTEFNCTSCNQSAVLNTDTGQCECLSGQFYNVNNRLCDECHLSCFECSGPNSFDCTSCYSDSQIQDDGSCLCTPPKYRDAFDQLCKHCDPGLIWNGEGCEEDCLGGFFLNDQVCEPCIPYCQTCTILAAFCTSCWSDSHPVNNTCHCIDSEEHHNPQTGQCQRCPGDREWNYETQLCEIECGETEYLTEDVCMECDPTCRTCETGTACASCRDDAQLQEGGECVCRPPNTHFDEYYRCISCPPGQQRDATNSTCVFNCASNEFVSEGLSCQPCHYSCRSCSGGEADDCDDCRQDANYVEGSCECKNPSEHADPDSGQCQRCPNDQTWSLTSLSCITRCNPGQFAQGTRCLYCSALCLTCEASSTNCTKCKSPIEELVDGDCICQLPSYRSGVDCIICAESYEFDLDQAICVPICEYSETLVDNVCVACDKTCATCEGTPTFCTSCIAEANHIHGDGTCTCINSDYHFDESGSCVGCPGESVWNGQNCVTYCASNEFVSNFTCQPCNVTCLTCSGGGRSQCQSCKSFAQLIQGFCDCVENYHRDPDDVDQVCFQCEGDTRWSTVDQTCVDNDCGLYFYFDANLRSCTPCHVTCRTCSGQLDNQCLSCRLNETLTDSFTCECLAPNFRNLADNACVTQCPPQTLPNLSTRECIPLCEAGKYHDVDTGRCRSCYSAFCLHCSGPSVSECDTCAEGFVFIEGGGCEIGCPTGYLANGLRTCTEVSRFLINLEFSAIFAGQSIVDFGVNIHAIPQNTSTSPNQQSQAISLKDRGIWFDTESTIKLTGLALYKEFSCCVWIKPHESGVILANQADTLSIRRRLQQGQGDLIKQYNQLIFETVGGSVQMSVREEGKPDFILRSPSSVKPKNWSHLGLSVEGQTSETSKVEISANGNKVAQKIGDFQYRDDPNTVHYVGGRPLGGVVSKSYEGGMSHLEIINASAASFDSFIQFSACLGGCSTCPLDGICLGTCCPNQYEEDGECKRCLPGCDSCVRGTDCNLCADPDCVECTGFANEECISRRP